VSSHEIHHLLNQYGLAAAFAAVGLQAFCLPVPGSTILIAASVYAASRHGFSIFAVIAVGTAASVTGGSAGFLFGRWRGEWALLKLGRLLRRRPEQVQHLRALLDRHAAIALIASRWFTGTRNGAGIASGASGTGVARFLAISTLAGLIWATVTGFEFYFFGSVLLAAPLWLKVLVIIGGIVAAVAVLRLVQRLALRTVERP